MYSEILETENTKESEYKLSFENTLTMIQVQSKAPKLDFFADFRALYCPRWHFHRRRKRLLDMKEPNKVKDNQYFWTILKESVKKLRNRRPKKKKKGKEKQLLPKGMFQVTQNMIHSLLLG